MSDAPDPREARRQAAARAVVSLFTIPEALAVNRQHELVNDVVLRETLIHDAEESLLAVETWLLAVVRDAVFKAPGRGEL